MSQARGERWVQVVAIAVPMACFGFARWMLDIGPAFAPGAEPNAVIHVPEGEPARAPTPQQRLAAEWARTRHPANGLRSPMSRGVSIAVADPVVPEPDPVEPPPPDPAAMFTVTSLMEAGAQQLATINGVTYAPGDEIAPGYRLVRVLGHRRIAVISCPDGRSFDLKPRP